MYLANGIVVMLQIKTGKTLNFCNSIGFNLTVNEEVIESKQRVRQLFKEELNEEKWYHSSVKRYVDKL